MNDMKNKKNTVTRQQVIKNLKHDNIPTLIMGLAFMIFDLMIVLPLTIFIIGESDIVFSRMFDSLFNTMSAVGTILLIAVFISGIAMPFIMVADACVKLSMVNNGRFLVEIDKVDIKTIETKRRIRYKRIVYVDERVLYFKKFGRFVVSVEDFENETLDDSYYVVAYDVKKPKALYVYNTAKYQYTERG